MLICRLAKVPVVSLEVGGIPRSFAGKYTVDSKENIPRATGGVAFLGLITQKCSSPMLVQT